MVVDVESCIEASGTLARKTIKEDSDHEYGMRRFGCAQENDQLPCENTERADRGREGSEGAAGRMRRPWVGAMETTLFTGWVYDHLLPHARELKVAHPLMLKAIAAGKKKNDGVDAGKIADPLRCDLLPECYMAPSVSAR